MSLLFTRRRLLVGAAFVPVAGLLAACGGGSSTPAASESTTASSSGSTPAASSASPTPPSVAVPTMSASPQSTEAAAGPVADVDFVVVDGAEPASLDPCVGTAYTYAVNAIFNKLVIWNPDMQIEPSLATSWEVSDDHSEWTFKLRPNVKFHDGSPFNSAAVKATIDHILDPETKSNRRSSYTLIKEVKTPDDLTAIFVTDPITPDFPFLMADGSANIICPAAMEKQGATDYGRKPVGTGPFTFTEWIPNDHITMTLNEDYWGPKPLVRRFVYKPVPEPATRVIVLRSGQADVVLNLPPEDIEDLKKDAKLNVVDSPSLTVVQIQLKQTKPPFSDKRVRQAVNMAIDKAAIIKSVMRGYGRPLKTPDCPGLWGAFEFDELPYDPDKAKSLLKEAGYPDGFDVTLTYTSGRWAGDDQVVQAVQGYWSQVGIKMTINKGDQAAFVADLTKDPNEFPNLVVMPVRTSYYSDYHLHRLYQSDAAIAVAAQRSGYSNPEVDKLFVAERNEFDPDKRLAIFKELQQLIWEDQPFAYLFSQVNLWGQQKSASGFGVLPSGDLVIKQLKKA